MHRRADLLALAWRAVDDPVRPDIQRPFALAALVVQDGQPLPQRLLGHEQRGFLFADLERQGDDLRSADHINRVDQPFAVLLRSLHRRLFGQLGDGGLLGEALDRIGVVIRYRRSAQ